MKSERTIKHELTLKAKYNLEEKYERKKEWRENLKEPPHILCGMYLKGSSHHQSEKIILNS